MNKKKKNIVALKQRVAAAPAEDQTSPDKSLDRTLNQFTLVT